MGFLKLSWKKNFWIIFRLWNVFHFFIKKSFNKNYSIKHTGFILKPTKGALIYSTLGCLDGARSSLISKKWLIWFIMISPAKFQPPNPCITATNCISRFRSFGRFVWKSKKLPNFFIFDKLLSFLFWISCFGYLKVLHVEFSENLSLVWLKIKFFKILSAILYGKFDWSRISRNKA